MTDTAQAAMADAWITMTLLGAWQRVRPYRRKGKSTEAVQGQQARPKGRQGRKAGTPGIRFTTPPARHYYQGRRLHKVVTNDLK